MPENTKTVGTTDLDITTDKVLPNPYPNSKDASNTVVDATADGLRL